MKPTIKVSIGGLAFNIDEDAYQVIDRYLDSLKNHFKANPERDEIISDIEARMSELLTFRLNSIGEVITIQDAHEIIKIMGNPKDFGDEEETNATSSHTTENSSSITPFFKKKLYRDTSQSVLGGVCSGIGHYLRFDPVAVRILWIAITILIGMISSRHPYVLISIALYIILLIIMPKAKTFVQKISMTGSDPSIEDIEDRNISTARPYRGSFLRKAFNVIINIIVGLIVAVSFLSLVTVIIAFIWACCMSDSVGVNDILGIVGLNTFYFKASTLLIAIIPLLIILYLSLKALFRSRFTIRDTIVCLTAIALWIAATAYISVKGYNLARETRQDAIEIEEVPLATTSDTLHIKLESNHIEAIPMLHNNSFFYIDDSSGKRSLIHMPRVVTIQDSTITNIEVTIKKKVDAPYEYIARKKAKEAKLDYHIQGSTMTISPQLYNKDHQWNWETYWVSVKVPANKTVIVDEPLLRQGYNGNFRISRNRIGWQFD